MGENFANHIYDKGLVTRMYVCNVCLYLTTQQQNDKKTNIKQRIWIDISQKKIYKWPVDSKKILNTTSYQETVSQNLNEISLHTLQDS